MTEITYNYNPTRYK